MFPNLRAEMARKRYTITRLAAELGITRKGLDNKLSGKTEFKLGEILKICEILGVNDVNYLFTIEGKRDG